MTRRLMMTLCVGALLAAAAPARAQQEIVGPPPQERANMQAFQKAFNTSAEAYEAMTKTVFSADYLKKQTPAQRKAQYEAMRAFFGDIAFQQVSKNGPDEPLEINVKGSKKSGMLFIDVDDASRITNIRAEMK